MSGLTVTRRRKALNRRIAPETNGRRLVDVRVVTRVEVRDARHVDHVCRAGPNERLRRLCHVTGIDRRRHAACRKHDVTAGDSDGVIHRNVDCGINVLVRFGNVENLQRKLNRSRHSIFLAWKREGRRVGKEQLKTQHVQCEDRSVSTAKDERGGGVLGQ